MKILYIISHSYEVNGITHFGCYQASFLLHGLKKLYGEKVLDYPKCLSQYKNTELRLNENLDEKYKFCSMTAGNGFTHLFNIEEDINNQKSYSYDEIEKNILNNEFDVIFFSVICNHFKLRSFENLFNKAILSKSKVCIIDGSDLHNMVTEVIHYDYVEKLEKINGYYFKRELLSNQTKVIKPISFAFPKEKILDSPIIKNKLFAMETFSRNYKFKIEQDYYNEYKQSFFGRTMRKGGWDCMRHYEIIFNRCIPYFEDIDNLPPNVMTSFPKDLVKLGMKTLNNNLNVDEKNYYEIESEIFKYSLDNLTTEALARKVMNIILN